MPARGRVSARPHAAGSATMPCGATLDTEWSVALESPAVRPAPAPFLQHTRVLDGLRGLAGALVYVYHADFLVRTGTATPVDLSGTSVSPLAAFVRAGNTGVSLFFVLSGFLLSRPFMVELRGAVGWTVDDTSHAGRCGSFPWTRSWSSPLPPYTPSARRT